MGKCGGNNVRSGAGFTRLDAEDLTETTRARQTVGEPKHVACDLVEASTAGEFAFGIGRHFGLDLGKRLWLAIIAKIPGIYLSQDHGLVIGDAAEHHPVGVD